MSECAEAYRIVRSELEHEDQLISNRLSWLVSSQAFLLTGYAISLNAPTAAKTGLYAHLNGILFDILPLGGLAGALLIYPSIVSAIIVTTRLRRQACRMVPADFPAMQETRATLWLAHLGPVLIPWIFILTWSVLLGVRLLHD